MTACYSYFIQLTSSQDRQIRILLHEVDNACSRFPQSGHMGLSSLLLLHGGCLLHVLRNEASGGGKEDAGCKQKLQAIQVAPSEPPINLLSSAACCQCLALTSRNAQMMAVPTGPT